MTQEVPAASQEAICRFAQLVRSGAVTSADGPLRLGVDLGTANIVLAVVDAAGRPVAGAWQAAGVVRDGIVVDYLGAVSHVRRLKEKLEYALGHHFDQASVDIPPAISPGDRQIFANVLTACDLSVTEIVDEPVAAARVLQLRDGCVIDIGHGTTGVSVLADGRVVHSADQATGGHHMTLVLAGRLGLGYDEAEAFKKDPHHQAEVNSIVTPTLQKMATIARDIIAGYRTPVIYLVGGASSLTVAPAIFEQVLGQAVIHPDEPLFVTPLGVPMWPPLDTADTTSTFDTTPALAGLKEADYA